MIDVIDLFNACLYIQENLEADLSLLFLAQTVGLSRFRFHRVFKAWRGETLHDFVTRMRMQRAAFELRYPVPRSNRRSIKAIAFASGYKSLSSFSHAFSAYAHLSPREYRNRALRSRPVHRWADVDTTRLGPFSIAISEEPAREIAVFDTVTRQGDALAAKARPALVDTARIAGDRYGVELLPSLYMRTRQEPRTGRRAAPLSAVGAELDEWKRCFARRGREAEIAPRSTITLEAGRYAVVRGHGSLLSLYRAWVRHFDAWLGASGECPRSARIYMRFPGGDVEANALHFTLYIPLEPAVTGTHRASGRSRPVANLSANSGERRPPVLRHTKDRPALAADSGR